MYMHMHMYIAGLRERRDEPVQEAEAHRLDVLRCLESVRPELGGVEVGGVPEHVRTQPQPLPHGVTASDARGRGCSAVPDVYLRREEVLPAHLDEVI